MLYDAFRVSEVAGMDRVPVLAVDDEVAVRVYYQALGIRVEVLLTSYPKKRLRFEHSAYFLVNEKN